MAAACPYYKLLPEDYQTTSRTYHRFVPSFQQSYNFNIKPHFRPNLLVKDVAVDNETFKTETKSQYGIKSIYLERFGKAPRAVRVNYIRPVQENYLKTLISPPDSKISETKSSFGLNYYRSLQENLELPTANSTNKSTVQEQFSIAAEKKGYCKYLDTYLTNNKCDYKIYNSNKVEDKIITFYNAKEFLPCTAGNQTALRNRTFSRAPKNLLMKSETKDKFKPIAPYPIEFCIQNKLTN